MALPRPCSGDASANLYPSIQGGFSYVYLVQDTSTSELFALKKIRCPFGAESVAQAMREVDAYKTFARIPGIIHSVDHAVATDRGGGASGIGTGTDESKVVYVLLPYYKRGNLQDVINANTVDHTNFPEKKLMRLFLGVCRALKAMHQYRGAPTQTMQIDEEPTGRKKKGKQARQPRQEDEDEDEDEDHSRPLMHGQDTTGVPPGQKRSYAHRDIKPGTIILLRYPRC